MPWNQIADGWRQLIAVVAAPRNRAREAKPKRDRQNRADAFGGARYWEAELPPYVPDSRRERSDSSPHLGC